MYLRRANAMVLMTIGPIKKLQKTSRRLARDSAGLTQARLWAPKIWPSRPSVQSTWL